MELESLAEKLDNSIDHEQKEEFHEYLRKYTDNYRKTLQTQKDRTFFDTKQLRENKDRILSSGGKDKSITIMDKTDYIKKTNDMIDKGISQGKYKKVTTDTIIEDLNNFESFLYRHFKKLYTIYRYTIYRSGRRSAVVLGLKYVDKSVENQMLTLAW